VVALSLEIQEAYGSSGIDPDLVDMPAPRKKRYVIRSPEPIGEALDIRHFLPLLRK
jgi:hypothetical protein